MAFAHPTRDRWEWRFDACKAGEGALREVCQRRKCSPYDEVGRVPQILLRELQTVSVSADMAADAVASVVITGSSKPAAKEGMIEAQAGPGLVESLSVVANGRCTVYYLLNPDRHSYTVSISLCSPFAGADGCEAAP